ncbi:phage major capsid protein [Streptomyces sp. MK37H]|uniref:phage major capsid family protein n=1 Tax=Streptomyces sp. MK37H TaxID=2699117 RepID=UPI001B35CBA9|nr:phage major capsid protein [Streptomyces sp. MK37H]MBP8537293.1 hypothetical protein [Streptomyces sp. MK37H]
MSLFTTARGAESITPDDFAALVVQPVQAESTAFQIATQLTTDSTRMNLPIVVEDAGAAWVSEGSEIPNEDAPLGEEVVTPAKVAGLTVVSFGERLRTFHHHGSCRVAHLAQGVGKPVK